MKARVIVAVIGIPVLLIFFLLLPTIATALLFAALCAISVHELLWVTGFLKNIRVIAVTMVMAAGVCIWSWFGMPGMAARIAVVIYLTYLFVELLLADLKWEFSAMCATIFAGLVLPYLLSSVVRILCMDLGRYFVIAPFFMTMIPDSGAFAFGMKFGKHKCFPNISPKKSTEGVIGGFLTGLLGMLLYGLILKLLGLQVNYLYCAIYGLVGAAGSVIGDLVFSTIKRQHSVKDFGKILPGHGGILDRFDSAIVVAPITELLLLLIPMAVK